ncbi:MAG: outer membrane lipoprotein carrier protein LolA [Rikenellaceae bacterium]|nr:outer membrane lipoprotein carrier protein LolA [Rikenellaceae bacterium]
MLSDCTIMRNLLIYILLALMPIGAMAQNDNQIAEKISRNSSQLQTLECDFVQTKYLKILNNKMVSRGKMYYQQPDKLRWEYQSPYSYILIMNQNKVLIKNNTRTDVIDINQNKMFKEIGRLMMNSIVGGFLNDQHSFDISITLSDGIYIATLLPLNREMKQMWTKLVLYFDPISLGVTQVEMHEKTGDYTVIELLNSVTNQSITPKTFELD